MRITFNTGTGAPAEDLDIQIYFGPRPKFGIAIDHMPKYAVPGEDFQGSMTYHEDPAQSGHPSSFFTEIVCWKQCTVDDEVVKRTIDAGVNAARAFKEAGRKHEADLAAACDWFAGIWGLRVHRQFVLNLVNENLVGVYGDAWEADSATSAIEMVCRFAASEQQLDQIIRERVAGPLSTYSGRAADAFKWLLRAWAEIDPISKFISLFIPLEMALKKVPGESSSDAKDEAIRNLIVEHAGANTDALIRHFEYLVEKKSPGLKDRFRVLAEEAKLPGWERDIVAFAKFYKIRNDLVHSGDPNVRLAHEIDKDDVTHLEDMVERYLSYKFFGDALVYPNPWIRGRGAKSRPSSL